MNSGVEGHARFHPVADSCSSERQPASGSIRQQERKCAGTITQTDRCYRSACAGTRSGEKRTQRDLEFLSPAVGMPVRRNA